MDWYTRYKLKRALKCVAVASLAGSLVFGIIKGYKWVEKEELPMKIVLSPAAEIADMKENADGNLNYRELEAMCNESGIPLPPVICLSKENLKNLGYVFSSLRTRPGDNPFSFLTLKEYEPNLKRYVEDNKASLQAKRDCTFDVSYDGF